MKTRHAARPETRQHPGPTTIDSSYDIVCRLLSMLASPTLAMIIKTSIGKLDASQELKPPTRHYFIHNGNRELRARHRAIQT